MIKKLLAILLLFFAVPCFADDTYYVTQSGAGSHNGSSGNEWSVAEFNNSAQWSTTEDNSAIDPGDTVYFSGTITTEVAPPTGYGGTSGNVVTLDGWEGGTCDPVADHDALCDWHSGGIDANEDCDNGVDKNACTSAAIIDPNYTSETDAGFQLQNNSYITIQDFQIRDVGTGLMLDDDGGTPTNVIFRRNYVHDVEYRCVKYLGSYEDYSYVTIGGASGDGNFFYNCAERNRDGASNDVSGSIDIMYDNNIFSYNEVVHDFRSTSSHNVIQAFHLENSLIEYNSLSRASRGAGVSIKETYDSSPNYNEDNIIRFNKITEVTHGISLSNPYGYGNRRTYIYGNYIFDVGPGDGITGADDRQAIRAFRIFDDIYIWSNVISYSLARGIAVMDAAGKPQGDVYIYNNTVNKCGVDTSITWSHATNLAVIAKEYDAEDPQDLNVRVANNILTDSDDMNLIIYNANLTDFYITTWDYNLVWDTDDSSPYTHWYWRAVESGGYGWETLADLQDHTVWADNTINQDAAYTDADGSDNEYGTEDDDLTITSSSPAKDAGTDLGGTNDWSVTVQGTTYYMGPAIGLDPRTDWTGRLPVVSTLSRDTHGWSMGAYAYLSVSQSDIESMNLY